MVNVNINGETIPFDSMKGALRLASMAVASGATVRIKRAEKKLQKKPEYVVVMGNRPVKFKKKSNAALFSDELNKKGVKNIRYEIEVI